MKTYENWCINWTCLSNDSESFNKTFESEDSARDYMAAILRQERANFYNDSEYQEGETMPVVMLNDGMTIMFKDGQHIFGILSMHPVGYEGENIAMIDTKNNRMLQNVSRINLD